MVPAGLRAGKYKFRNEGIHSLGLLIHTSSMYWIGGLIYDFFAGDGIDGVLKATHLQFFCNPKQMLLLGT